MRNKLRQVTDTIHGTIYLSDIESELISTPYFYRLHDIYQSSTVYMTFPTNRTKRYEHSLGAMELSTQMLFSSISNSDINTKKALFNQLSKVFFEIFNVIQDNTGVIKNVPYLTHHYEYINDSIAGINNDRSESHTNEEKNIDPNELVKKDIAKYIQHKIKNKTFSDVGLNMYQYSPVNITNDQDDYEFNYFLYQCLLQALRIVALFHDVGHPPYSHIIEAVINELYYEYKDIDLKDSEINAFRKRNIEKFKNSLCTYYEKNARGEKINTILFESNLLDIDQLHERIGLRLLMLSIEDVIPKKIEDIKNSEVKEDTIKICEILYFITVVEFTFGILTEKNNLFKSIHTIVDGTIDADRLDYISRDSFNSGVDWGHVPFKRVINSAKLFVFTETKEFKLPEDDPAFAIAYPKKLTDDLEEILLLRYKIFAKINYHHRCMKTTLTLQSVVKKLAKNYLDSNKEEECINPNIRLLWTSLGGSAGNPHMKIIKWNDSSLISELYNAFVTLCDSKKFKNQERYKPLKEDLEEILLNKKRFYAVFKRGTDCRELAKLIIDKAELNDEVLEKLKKHEALKLANADKTNESGRYDDVSNVKDSFRKFKLIEDYMETGDLELFDKLLATSEDDIYSIFKATVEKFKKNNRILDYNLHKNKSKSKNGLPKPIPTTTTDDEEVIKQKLDFHLKQILVYDHDKYEEYDDQFSLIKKLATISSEIVYIYLYIVPSNMCTDVDKLIDEIYDSLADSIGEAFKQRLNEWFSSLEKMEARKKYNETAREI